MSKNKKKRAAVSAFQGDGALADVPRQDNKASSWLDAPGFRLIMENLVPSLASIFSVSLLCAPIAGCWPNKPGWSVLVITIIVVWGLRHFTRSRTTLRRIFTTLLVAMLALVATLLAARAYLCMSVSYDSRQILRRVLQEQPTHDEYSFMHCSFFKSAASSSTNQNVIYFHISKNNGYDSWIHGTTPKDDQRVLFAINNLLEQEFIEPREEPQTHELNSNTSIKVQVYRITPKGINFHRKFTWGEHTVLRDVIKVEEYEHIEGEDRAMSRASKTPMLIYPDGGPPVEGAVPQAWPVFQM